MHLMILYHIDVNFNFGGDLNTKCFEYGATWQTKPTELQWVCFRCVQVCTWGRVACWQLKLPRSLLGTMTLRTESEAAWNWKLGYRVLSSLCFLLGFAKQGETRLSWSHKITLGCSALAYGRYTKTLFLGVINNVCNAFVHWTGLSVE